MYIVLPFCKTFRGTFSLVQSTCNLEPSPNYKRHSRYIKLSSHNILERVPVTVQPQPLVATNHNQQSATSHQPPRPPLFASFAFASSSPQTLPLYSPLRFSLLVQVQPSINHLFLPRDLSLLLT
jgi:hypothetical protein